MVWLARCAGACVGKYSECARKRGESRMGMLQGMLHMRVLDGCGWVGVAARQSVVGSPGSHGRFSWRKVPPSRRKSLTAITCNNATSISKEIAGLGRPMITGVRILRCDGIRCGISGEGAPDVLADCHTTKERLIPVARDARSGGALCMKMDTITG